MRTKQTFTQAYRNATLRMLLLTIPIAAASHALGDEKVEAQVRLILQKNCSECHGADKPRRIPLHEGVNLAKLREDLNLNKATIQPGNPQASELYQRITAPDDDDSRMPQSKGSPGQDGFRSPLAKNDQNVIAAWIRGDLPQETDRPFVTDREVTQVILADLEQASSIDQKQFRYVSLHNLYNLGPTEEPERNFDVYRGAVNKLLNSLSWNRSIRRVEPIDPQKIVLRVNLRDYGWKPADWEKVLKIYPYAILEGSPQEKEVARLQGYAETKLAEVPSYVRADWLVFAAAQAPLYHELLYYSKYPDLPRPFKDSDLESRLGLDINKRLRQAARIDSGGGVLGRLIRGQGDKEVIRAGFQKSGVSLANRLIERHDMPGGGGYWKSYDFKHENNIGNDRKLALAPLGPPLAKLSRKEFAFQHDGGEGIFNLPNGLQAYLLATAEGTLLARAPIEVVQDSRRPDSRILNGISCMECHDQGMNSPPGTDTTDEIRESASRNLEGRLLPEELTALRRLYNGTEYLKEALAEDKARFLKALKSCEADGTSVEPIGFLYSKFKANVTLGRLSAEFNVDIRRAKTTWEEIFTQSSKPELKELATRSSGLKRQEFIPLFQEMVNFLEIGKLVPFEAVQFAEFGGEDNGSGLRVGSIAAQSPGQAKKPTNKEPVPGQNWQFASYEANGTIEMVWVPDSTAKGGGFWVEEFPDYVAPPRWTWRRAISSPPELTQEAREQGVLPANYAIRLPYEKEWEKAQRFFEETSRKIGDYWEWCLDQKTSGQTSGRIARGRRNPGRINWGPPKIVSLGGTRWLLSEENDTSINAVGRLVMVIQQ